MHMTFFARCIFRQFIAFLFFCFGAIASAQASEFLSAGKFAGNLNLRYESVDQDNSLADAQALTLRSRFSFTSAVVEGFSATVEVEDVRILAGIDNYSLAPTGFKLNRYSVIADPETTELDQGFVQYSNGRFSVKAGRQVIAYDNHRLVGHVGWRQDRQTFDAVSLAFKPIEKLSLSYNYLDKRRRIFAEDADLDSDDHLFHGDYETSLGKLSGYAYLLELDNGSRNSLDTVGLRLTGFKELGDYGVSYTLDYASQDFETSLNDYSADYTLLEAGLNRGGLNARLGHERMGSDGGAYGFATPLATVHAHNGWADLFLATPAGGLIDTYLSLAGKAGKGAWSVSFHDFEVDDAPSSSLASPSDLGNELDLQYLYPLSENSSLGIKYASYSGAELATGKPDTDKFWLWMSFAF